MTLDSEENMQKTARRQLLRIASRHPNHKATLRQSVRLDGSLDLNRLIRIASYHPELQPYLLPIIREAANQPGRRKGKAEAPYIVWTMDATDKNGNGGAILQKRPGVRGARKSIPAKWYIPLSDFKKKLKKVTDRKKRSALNVAQKSGIKAVRKLYKAWLQENWDAGEDKGYDYEPSKDDEDAFRLQTVNRVLKGMSKLKPSHKPTKRDIKRVQRLQKWLETGSQRREEEAEQAEMEESRMSGVGDRKRERAEDYRKGDRYQERAKGTEWETKVEHAGVTDPSVKPRLLFDGERRARDSGVWSKLNTFTLPNEVTAGKIIPGKFNMVPISFNGRTKNIHAGAIRIVDGEHRVTINFAAHEIREGDEDTGAFWRSLAEGDRAGNNQ